MLHKTNPGLRLIISFSDPGEGHHGGIYQATNWVYVGVPEIGNFEYFINGKWTHNRSVQVKYGPAGHKAIRNNPNILKRPTTLKHKYLYPLDEAMRKMVEPLRKPYPKRAVSKENVASPHQGEGGGAIPTTALHL